MAVVLIIIIVLIVLAAIFALVGFNKLRKADISAQEALGGIDVQLTRRADLVPNLVETVKGYASHEKGVFEAVTDARAQVSKAAASGTVEQKAAAEAALDRSLVNVMAVAENYPDLKASTNFLQLQGQLSDTENQLAFARQYYNDAVSRLNTLVVTIPWMFFNGFAKVSKRDFYQAPEGQAAPPQVSFS
ncbi:MAG: LemA family protein [Candidatus Nanopelagicales bacterium]